MMGLKKNTSLIVNKKRKQNMRKLMSVTNKPVTKISEEELVKSYLTTLHNTENNIVALEDAFALEEEAYQKMTLLSNLSTEDYTPYVAKDAAMYLQTLGKRLNQKVELISTEDINNTVNLSTEGIGQFIIDIIATIYNIIAAIVKGILSLFGFSFDSNTSSYSSAKTSSDNIAKAIATPTTTVPTPSNSTTTASPETTVPTAQVVETIQGVIADEGKKSGQELAQMLQDGLNSTSTEDHPSGYTSISGKGTSLLYSSIKRFYPILIGSHLTNIPIKMYIQNLIDSNKRVLQNMHNMIKDGELAFVKAISSGDIEDAEVKMNALINFISGIRNGHKLVLPVKKVNSSGLFDGGLVASESDDVFICGSHGEKLVFVSFSAQHKNIQASDLGFSATGYSAVLGGHEKTELFDMINIKHHHSIVNMIGGNKELLKHIKSAGELVMNEIESTFKHVDQAGRALMAKLEAEGKHNSTEYHLFKENLTFFRRFTVVIPAILHASVGTIVQLDKALMEILKFLEHEVYAAKIGR